MKTKEVKASVNGRSEIGIFFLDSGAHSLYTKHVIKQHHKDGYSFYDMKKGSEFRQYVDAYSDFVKQHKKYIDYYANVDAIFNPEKSWEVLKYMEEEHGLSPIPVIHYGTSLTWIRKHLDAGYEYIGLGGLGQEATAVAYRKWADSVFAMICPGPSNLPTVRTHGFAMTSYPLMLRFPWWSVDSATWTKLGAFGNVMIPHKRQGKFTFEKQPYNVTVSKEAPCKKQLGKHFDNYSKAEQKIILEWLEQIGVPFGKTEADGTITEFGVSNRHSERKIANLLCFEKLREWMPKYPWPFRGVQKRTGFGLV